MNGTEYENETFQMGEILQIDTCRIFPHYTITFCKNCNQLSKQLCQKEITTHIYKKIKLKTQVVIVRHQVPDAIDVMFGVFTSNRVGFESQGYAGDMK